MQSSLSGLEDLEMAMPYAASSRPATEGELVQTFRLDTGQRAAPSEWLPSGRTKIYWKHCRPCSDSAKGSMSSPVIPPAVQ